jgi:hypothetical protein
MVNQRNNVTIDPEKPNAVQDWPTPENTYMKELPWVVYILNEVRSWKRWNFTAVNTIDESEEDIQRSPDNEDAFTSLPFTVLIFCYLESGGKFTVDTGTGQEDIGGLSP